MWGKNQWSLLGDGTTADSLVPKQIGNGYTAIAAGIATLLRSRLTAAPGRWGNVAGQIGDGTSIIRQVPTLINMP